MQQDLAAPEECSRGDNLFCLQAQARMQSKYSRSKYQEERIEEHDEVHGNKLSLSFSLSVSPIMSLPFKLQHDACFLVLHLSFSFSLSFRRVFCYRSSFSMYACFLEIHFLPFSLLFAKYVATVQALACMPAFWFYTCRPAFIECLSRLYDLVYKEEDSLMTRKKSTTCRGFLLW